jgi:ketosteroid isomerase-like protein
MSDEAAIAAQRRAWLSAFHAEDIPAMSRFVTEDHFVMPPNQPQRAGLKAAQEFWQAGFSAAKSEMEIHPDDLTIAGDVAIDRFNWKQRMQLKDGDKSLEDDGVCVWIWRRGQDGSWRIQSAIWNSDRAEPGIWSRAPGS